LRGWQQGSFYQFDHSWIFQHSLEMQNIMLQKIMYLQENRLHKHQEAEYYQKTLMKSERLLEDTTDLADVVKIIAADLELDSNSLDFEDRPIFQIKQRISEARLKRAQQIKFAARILERDEKQFAWSQSVRSFHESEGVKRLTVLAAIFLPLSLTCSILSMQTRFADLHYLLYDFLGVFIILVSMSIVAYLLIRTMVKWSATWSLGSAIMMVEIGFSKKDSEGIGLVYVLKHSLYIAVWTVVLVSFIVGMVVDVQIGGKVLGYGLGGILGCILLSIVFLVRVLGALQ
jgi:hypothetical protein